MISKDGDEEQRIDDHHKVLELPKFVQSFESWKCLRIEKHITWQIIINIYFYKYQNIKNSTKKRKKTEKQINNFISSTW